LALRAKYVALDSGIKLIYFFNKFYLSSATAREKNKNGKKGATEKNQSGIFLARLA